MDRMTDQGFWLICHLAQIFPAAGVYASTLMLNVHLQGDDGTLHIVAWLVFFVSAGLVLTSHHTLSGVNPRPIAAVLAILSVVRLVNEPRSQQDSWVVALRLFMADYLRSASLVAIALAVGFSAPTRGTVIDPEADWPEECASQPSQDSASRILSEKLVGPMIADWLSDVSSICFKHMGPGSRAPSRSSCSSRSSRASDILLNLDRPDTAREQWIQDQGRIIMGRPQNTIPQDVLNHHPDLP